LGAAAAVCGIAVMLASLSAVGQAQVKSPNIRTYTNLVLVDVSVIGRCGRQVRGLAQSDFRVFEDGKPQRIAIFRVDYAPVTPPPAPAPLPAFVYTNLPAYHPANGPLTVVLLDSLNTPLFDQDRMRMALVRYVAKLLERGQRVAILSLTDRLTMLQDFTTSRNLLLAAAKKFTPRESSQMGVREDMTSSAKDNEYLDVLQMARSCQNCAAVVEFYNSLKAMDRHILTMSDEQRAEITASALDGIAGAFAGYPGRKSLIWISASFPPLYPGGPHFKLAWSAENQLHHAADMLNAARVTVYPVDPRGLIPDATPQPGVVGQQEIDQQGRGAYYESTPDYYQSWDRLVRSPMYNLFSSQATMRTVAKATGGVAFYNSNDIAHAIARAATDARNSYLIGYYPTNSDWNGKFRRITIHLAEKGAELRYRHGYYAIPSFARSMAKPEVAPNAQLQAALLDPLPATALAFRVYAPPPTPGANSEAAGQILLPGASVRLGASCSLNVSFRVAAIAPSGAIAAERGSDVRRNFDAQQCATVRRGAIAFRYELPLKPGRYQLEFLVRDNRTAALGRIDVPVDVRIH
jgi:VWFA-related protein